MKTRSLSLVFALLFLGTAAVLMADSPEPQEQPTATESLVEALPLPDGSADLTFLSHNDPPSCSGQYAGQICYQWSLTNCHPPGSGICLCSQWIFVGGQFQCAGGVCDCA